jgi:hypothetical protein
MLILLGRMHSKKVGRKLTLVCIIFYLKIIFFCNIFWVYFDIFERFLSCGPFGKKWIVNILAPKKGRQCNEQIFLTVLHLIERVHTVRIDAVWLLNRFYLLILVQQYV